MKTRLFLSLAVLTMFSSVDSVTAQEQSETRIDVVTINTGDVEPQIEAALRAAGTTMALTLRLLGRYDVTTDFSFEWTDREAYVDSLELGTVDRIIVMEGSRRDGDLVLEAMVVNPLDSTVEIQRREELTSILGLFDAVDRISAGLIGELAGERIAFGSLEVLLDGWDGEQLRGISLRGIPVIIEPANPPAESDYSISIDGASVDGGLRAERVLIGEHVLRVHHNVSGRVVAQRTISVEEGRQFQATVAVPLLNEAETNGVKEAVAAVNTARSEWKTTGAESALRQWQFSLQGLKDRLSALEFREELIDLEQLAIYVAEIDLEMQSGWKEPEQRWRTELSSIASLVDTTEPLIPVAEEITTEIERLVTAIPQLYSLAAAAAVENNDISQMEGWYGARGIPDLPQWFLRDRQVIEQLLQEYREGRRDRRGLYRVLKFGGIGIALGGGVTWGVGFDSSRQANELYDDYRDAGEIDEIGSLREEIEEKDAQGQLLQGGGIALSATGIASFVAGAIIQRRDQKVPERLLQRRLDGYFGPRIELYETLAEEDKLTALPIPEFPETVTPRPDISQQES